jgi:hypothetical protein
MSSLICVDNVVFYLCAAILEDYVQRDIKRLAMDPGMGNRFSSFFILPNYYIILLKLELICTFYYSSLSYQNLWPTNNE